MPPPPDSRRKRILAVVIDRLERILSAEGFRTDVGAHVFVSELPQLGPDDPGEVIGLFPREDRRDDRGLGKTTVTLPIDIIALSRVAPGDARSTQVAWLKLEDVIADVKQAMELDAEAPDDPTFGGLLLAGDGNSRGLEVGTVEPYEREGGLAELGVLLTYGLTYAESFGRPEL